MKFYALVKHGLPLLHTTLCVEHFSARWIDELITWHHDGEWVELSHGQIRCQICGAVPPPRVKDYYICGNIKVPKK